MQSLLLNQGSNSYMEFQMGGIVEETQVEFSTSDTKFNEFLPCRFFVFKFVDLLF